MQHSYLRTKTLKRIISLDRRSDAEESPEESSSPSLCANEPDHTKQPAKPRWRCFSYEEIDKATDGFHRDNLVGRGRYAEVYKGVLEDGQAIAVKRLTKASADKQKEKEFLMELGTIGHVRHPNVCSLLGCCIDQGLHFIFEFSSHGSVCSNLHDENSPPMASKLWYNIAMAPPGGFNICTRDAREGSSTETSRLPMCSLLQALSPRCLAPEYFMHGSVHEKTDVFAFGVFLLELISGRKPVNVLHKSLLSWARPYLNDGTI